jgi:hypothetical protein
MERARGWAESGEQTGLDSQARRLEPAQSPEECPSSPQNDARQPTVPGPCPQSDKHHLPYGVCPFPCRVLAS